LFFFFAATAFACFCAACLCVAFGDLSPIFQMVRFMTKGVNTDRDLAGKFFASFPWFLIQETLHKAVTFSVIN
jgi:hypothetical protein